MDTLAMMSNGEATELTLADAFRRQKAEAEFGVVDTGRYKCRYYLWGNGPTLVFVHGMSDDASSFVLPIMLLSSSFRCLAYDLPLGKDDGARVAHYRHADLVDDLFALLDGLGIDQAYVLGSSFGSTVSFAAMAAKPERLPRGVVQGGFAHRPLALPESCLAWAARSFPGSMGSLPLRRLLLAPHWPAFKNKPIERWNFFVQRCSSPPTATVARRAWMLQSLDLRHLLPSIRQPLLMICAEADPLVGKSCEQDLLAGLPNATRIELTGTGHSPHYTHPEVFADTIRSFLIEEDSAAPRNHHSNHEMARSGRLSGDAGIGQ